MSQVVDAVVVGLGAMGLPMARNLASAGLTVVGVDPSRARREEAAGLVSVASLAEAPPRRAVLAMVATPAQLTAVVDEAQTCGPDSAVWILAGTLGVDAVLTESDRLRALGANVVDAPVTGGVAGARAGTLLVFAAGDAEDLAAARPVLDEIGTAEVVGARIGDGQRMKLVNQHLCSIHLVAAAEALTFAGHLGLDQEQALALLVRGGAASWMLADRGPRMLDRPDGVNSAIDIFVKDSHLVQDAADAAGAPAPVLAAARALLDEAAGQGLGAEDDSQVIAAYHRS